MCKELVEFKNIVSSLSGKNQKVAANIDVREIAQKVKKEIQNKFDVQKLRTTLRKLKDRDVIHYTYQSGTAFKDINTFLKKMEDKYNNQGIVFTLEKVSIK